jgi:lysophospholipid acyltransferase (LPLAT)-like uncharacterized protein
VKRLMRNPAVQALLALLLTGYLRLALGTIRWRREGESLAEAARASGAGLIVCLWHGRIALSPASWPLRDRAGPEPRALISLSPDGAFIARAMAWLGVPAIRGSSTKSSDKAKPKGGAAAFREALAWLQDGGGLAMTPDGPRGPAEQMAPGAVQLARLAGVPVLLAGLACRPAIRLSSWDGAVLPLPFARGAVVWAGPFTAPAEAGDGQVAELQRDWSRALSDATARAEALAA